MTHRQPDGGREIGLPREPRHLRRRVRAERIVPGLQRPAAGAPPPVPARESWGRSITRSAKRSRTRSAPTARAESSRILDNRRPELDDGPSHLSHPPRHQCEWDLRASIRPGQSDGSIDGGIVDALAGGWQLATIVKWQSGAPLSDRLEPRHVQPRGSLGPSDGRHVPERANRSRDLLGVLSMPDGQHLLDQSQRRSTSSGRLVAT